MVTIRPALPNDAGQIAGIQVRTWQATYRGDLPDAFLDSLDASRREEMCRDKPGNTLPGWPQVIPHRYVIPTKEG